MFFVYEFLTTAPLTVFFILGTLIPKNCVDSLIEALSTDAEKVEEKTF